jgi:conjugal transfer ATP-binding protein TraC
MITDILRKALEPLFNKYGVTNIEDLLSLSLSRFKTIRTPEKAVLEGIENNEVAPHLHELNMFFEIYRLAHVLDAEFYDEVKQVYQTGSGFGFILSATTLIGAKDQTAELLNGIFNIGVPEGACIQFLLVASGELSSVFNNWKSNRKSSGVFDNIANARVDFLNSGTKKRLFPRNKMNVRNFRLFITFTFDGLFQEENYGLVENIRNAASSQFKAQGIECRNFGPEEYINLCKELLAPKQSGIEYSTYDETLPLRDQVADPDNNIYIDRDGIVINDTAIRSLGIKRYPSHLYLNSMNGVIGDQFSAMLQIPYPFVLCCNIQVLNPETTNGKLRIESERVQNQARNGIGRYLPVVNRKAQEYQFCNEILANGEGFVNVGHFLHIYTPLGKSEEAFQEAQAVFRSQNFELVNYSNIQFPALLSSIPLFFEVFLLNNN